MSRPAGPAEVPRARAGRPPSGTSAGGGAADGERRRELDRLDWLGRQLDARWRLPGTSIRVGLDGLVGLIPGIGDTLAALPSAYLILRGWQLGARKRVVARMVGNAGLDYVLGAVPLVGDLFDVGFKGNLRNVALLRAELGAPEEAAAPQHGTLPPPLTAPRPAPGTGAGPTARG